VQITSSECVFTLFSPQQLYGLVLLHFIALHLLVIQHFSSEFEKSHILTWSLLQGISFLFMKSLMYILMVMCGVHVVSMKQVRVLMDYTGDRVESAGPSTAVQVPLK
jgi:hypothetical protein